MSATANGSVLIPLSIHGVREELTRVFLSLQFHLGCVGLQSIPKGNWLCDDCRDLMPKKRR